MHKDSSQAQWLVTVTTSSTLGAVHLEFRLAKLHINSGSWRLNVVPG